jgi:hypothetical protein
MKVFQIDEEEFWFGETLDAAFDSIFAETGSTREEYEREFKPRELTEEEMDKPNEVDLSENGDGSDMGSYRDALDIAMADGRTAGVLCARN